MKQEMNDETEGNKTRKSPCDWDPKLLVALREASELFATTNNHKTWPVSVKDKAVQAHRTQMIARHIFNVSGILFTEQQIKDRLTHHPEDRQPIVDAVPFEARPNETKGSFTVAYDYHYPEGILVDKGGYDKAVLDRKNIQQKANWEESSVDALKEAADLFPSTNSHQTWSVFTTDRVEQWHKLKLFSRHVFNRTGKLFTENQVRHLLSEKKK